MDTDCEHHEACNFFGEFGFITQFILAILSFAVLIFKHSREVPKRETTVFQYDMVKNGGGAVVAHVTNLVLATLFAGDSDPCPWYFVNILFDTTVVVGLNYLLLRLAERAIKNYFSVDVTSGQYGTPPDKKRFFQQLIIWLSVVLISKSFLSIFFYLLQDSLAAFARLVLSPLCFSVHLELFVVMVLAPLVLNAFQFWMQDNFLKLGGGYIALATDRGAQHIKGLYSSFSHTRKMQEVTEQDSPSSGFQESI